MKYVEWVESVLQGVVAATLESSPGHLVGLPQIVARIGVDPQSAPGAELDGATWTAIEDLEALGLLDVASTHWVRITQEARKTRHGGSLRDVWPTLARRFLEPDQEAFLKKTVEMAERQHSTWADVDWIEAADVVRDLGWEDDVAVRYGVSAALEGEGLARVRAAMGGYVSLRPTYAGVVRATEASQAEWHERLKSLVQVGETANVEFKRELHLDRDQERAQFVRDVLALANTNVSGARYLLIGFDPLTLAFSRPVDVAITQDRLEDILNAWTEPTPEVRFRRIETPGGIAGVLEVFRDARRVPYMPSRSFGKTLAPDVVFVRHGSHVERPSEAETADLFAEALRARGRAE